jgi:hypothetical protein
MGDKKVNNQPIDLRGPGSTENPGSALKAKASPQFISRRGQVFAMGLGMLVFLLCFTLPAMWEHIGSLKPQYETMAKIGALSPEFAIFCFLLFHSWDRSKRVRKWSLIFGAVLAGLVVVHAAGLWGLKDGAERQQGIEDRLTEKLNEYGKQTAETAENKRSTGQPITRAEVREEGRTKRARDLHAQQMIRETIVDRTENIHEASFLSEGYLNGPMYMVNFLVALLFVSALTWMHFSAKIDDIDEDGDGVADITQGKIVNYHGQDYALNPQTGQADPQWAEFMKSRDMGQLFNQWEAQRLKQNGRGQDQSGRTYSNSPLGPVYDEGQIMMQRGNEPPVRVDVNSESIPISNPPTESEPIRTGPWAKAQNGKSPNV